MEIQITELEPCKLKVDYETGAEDILNKRAEVLEHFKKAPCPGSRPGRASLQAIKIHYKDQINESLKRALCEDAFHNTVFEKKLRPHGPPRMNSALLLDGKFSCEFEMFTKPDFEVAPFKDVQVVKPHSKTSIEILTEQILQECRERFGVQNPFTEDDFVQEGDHVIVDFEGFVDGEKVDTLCAQGQMIAVGKGNLKEFDLALIGMKIGETREFNLEAPGESLPSLTGKTIKFKALLTMGSKIVPCALDDELAKKAGMESFEDLRNFCQGRAQKKFQQDEKNALNEAVCSKVAADNSGFEIPPWLILSEARYLAHRSEMDWDKMENADKEKFMIMAEKHARLSLILDKVREDEPEAQLSDQEVFDMIKQNLLKSASKNNPEDVMKELIRTGQYQILASRIKDEYCLDFLVKSMKLIEN